MVSHTTDGLERIIHRLALSVAVLVAVSVPLGYGLVEYEDAVDSLDFKARIKASALSGLISSIPETWMFAENRIQGLIAREPVPLENELVQVLDHEHAVITQAGTMPSGPILKRSYPLFDASTKVGEIAITGSLDALVQLCSIATFLSVTLGVVVYAMMKMFPLKALKSVTDALYKEKERAETTLQSIGDAVITTDADSSINYLNPAAERLLGRTLKEIRGQQVATVIRLQDADSGAMIESSLQKALKTNTIVSCQGNSEIQRSDGRTVAVEERSAPINDRDGTISGGVVVLRDVSVAREYVQRRSWEATHDPLTELFNRREFEARVERALTDTKAAGRIHALCYMDLDHFKVVNDSCGHAAGDELLVRLSQLMQERIRATDTLARLGGDEFGLLLEACDERSAQFIAAEIMAAVNDFQFAWKAKVHTVGISIGLTMLTPGHRSVAEIIGEADCACYWAKEQGKNRALVFAANDMSLAARRSETGWVARINDAFKEDRFVLYHQAYRMLGTSVGHNEHLEVLLRMIGEDGEVIAPGRFLPAAERYNLMPSIDRWVIHEVFSHYDGLVADRGGSPLTCAINLSGASINAEGMLDFIQKQAHKYKLAPRSICFEVTETVAVNNLEAAAEFIRELKTQGFQFALDDFGTGSSSFGYLRNLPVDYLKIDGGFVKNIEHDSVDQAMLESINHIGHLLGKITVAEYCENEAIIGKLRTIGVDFAQGYGVCRPKPLFATFPVASDREIFTRACGNTASAAF